MRADPSLKVSAATAHERASIGKPLGLLAVRLLGWARQAGAGGLIHVASSGPRAERVARLVRGLAPDLEVLVFPSWDCLPYDRTSPSRESMGRRVAVLSRLANGDAPALIVTTLGAAIQRVPPRAVWQGASLSLAVGEALQLGELEAFFRRAGYVLDERVDEPGEAAIRGGVVDAFPAGATPYRVEHEDGRITAIRAYDPVSQRSIAELQALVLEPVSELLLAVPCEGEEPLERTPGMEHWLPDYYGTLEALFDLAPAATLVLDPETERRRDALMEQLADAHASGLRLRAGAETRTPLAPERLYMEAAEWAARLDERRVIQLEEGEDGAEVLRFVTERSPGAAFGAYVGERLAAGSRVVLAASGERDIRTLARRAEARAERAPEPAADWEAVTAAPAGSLLTLPLGLDAGFVDVGADVAVIAAADLLGSRAETAVDAGAGAPVELPMGEIEFRLGDAVIHMDHGMGVLRGLETVAPVAAEAATLLTQAAGAVGASDTVRLDYAGGATLMASVEEMDKIWRYGSDAEAVTLDRLDGEGWAKRRAKVEAEIDNIARRLVEALRARESTPAPKIVPPRREYERFAARFPFTETADQARAIAETLEDLGAGRPMDRLVCGDVGFGKTEVALRAAAAAALAGHQVAVVAPTTVLVRQHLRTFRRRFEGLGIEVGHLSRLVKPTEAKAVKAGLADGSIRVVVGTHALAAKGVRFKDLGLVVIDEEQRFGTTDKAKLRGLGVGAHVLTLTATPIPRTLQSAMVGLQSLSIIATPPSRRQPIRTVLMPFDAAAVREALIRERRRGGQSFVVCPRVEDIEPLQARLSELVPELEVLVAHGKLPAEGMDEAMVRFAEGEGDVLLATNIIESGLDVPRANTMLVWRADRFGLAQLHQLRGRVGRGRVRGLTHLLIERDAKISAQTEKRLRTLEALDRLGAGFAISARDLDQRGAGDLLGEEQAGHVKLIGVGLYQHLLGRALAQARGEAAPDDFVPTINLGLEGFIPEAYVPEPEVRINLYARLVRLSEPHEVDLFAEEIEDRFGPMPDPVANLLDVARLKALCGRLGVAKVDAGPQAIALSFREGEATRGERLAAADPALRWTGERLIDARPGETPGDRRRLALELLARLA